MRIRITKSDIENGKRQDCHFCPIALAIRRAFFNKHGRDPDNVSVSYADICINGKKALTPRKAFEFICDFDHGLANVMPFSFSVPL